MAAAGGGGCRSPLTGRSDAVVGSTLYGGEDADEDGERNHDNGSAYALDELLSCCFCARTFSEHPPPLLFLPCLHVCCSACLPSASSPPSGLLPACSLCAVRYSASTSSESTARASVLLGACARAAAAAERQCTLCQSDSGSTQTIAESECRQCGLRLCSSCARWHSRFKPSHVVTAFCGESIKDYADATVIAGVPQSGSAAASAAAAAAAGTVRRRWTCRRLAELRLKAAKQAALQLSPSPQSPTCVEHGLPCDTLCLTCERPTCCRCLMPSVTTDTAAPADALGYVGAAADGSCAGHQVASIVSDKATEYVRRVRTSLDVTMSHVECCLNAARSLHGDDCGGGEIAAGLRARSAAVDGRSNEVAAAGVMVPAVQAALEADLRKLLANKHLAMKQVERSYSTAERILRGAYSALEREAPARRRTVDRLSEQLQRARCYAELIACTDGYARSGDGVACDEDGGSSEDFYCLSATFLDQHGSLLTCVRELLRSASAAAAPAEGFVTLLRDCSSSSSSSGDGAVGCRAGAEAERYSSSDGNLGQTTPIGCPTIETLLLQQWLLPSAFPTTETTSSPGNLSGHSSSRGGGGDGSPCHSIVDVRGAGDASDFYQAGDSVAFARDVLADSSPGSETIDAAASAAVATPPCVASINGAASDHCFEKRYFSLGGNNDFNGECYGGGSGCETSSDVAAPLDLSDERQQQEQQQQQERWLTSLLTHCVLCEQRLDDPLLLACLHSCCRRCADTVAGLSFVPCDSSGDCTAAWPKNEPAQPRVACPMCGVTTHASSLKPNCLAAMLLSQRKTGSELPPPKLEPLPPRCDVCADQGYESEAQLTCFVCKQCYCQPCEQHHRLLNARHSVGPVSVGARQQQTPLPPSSVTVAQSCQLDRHDMFCIECDALRCRTCGKRCIECRHDLAAVGGQRMASFAREVADRLRRSAAVVAAQAAQASSLAAAPASTAAAASQHPSREKSTAATGSSDAISKAALLLVAARGRTAESYCSRLLLLSADTSLVLDQMSAVSSCLDTLRSELDAWLSGGSEQLHLSTAAAPAGDPSVPADLREKVDPTTGDRRSVAASLWPPAAEAVANGAS